MGRMGRLRGGTVYVVLAILMIGVLLTLVNVYELRKFQEEHYESGHAGKVDVEKPLGRALSKRRIAWLPGDKAGPHGKLKHVRAVLERLGYTFGDENSDWELMWSWDYPFLTMDTVVRNIKPYQKINHHPGCGHITNKNSLATSDIRNIPRAFKLPEDKNKFLAEVEARPNQLWVQKSNTHRGIKIAEVSNLDLNSEGSFVQKYVDNPLLIDNRKFDIGVYAVLTSINPLRAYVLDTEALFRYCAEDYHPFSASEPRRYVVGDDYTPTWQMPSLKDYYRLLGYSHKASFNAHLSKLGHKPAKVWAEIYETIREVYETKEADMVEAGKAYKSGSNFFEMVRFDFLVDADMNVYLMEVNMSPNLSSSHFSENRLMYEQVVFNTLSLVGIARLGQSDWTRSTREEREMLVADHDLVTGTGDELGCEGNCKRKPCRLSLPCMSDSDKSMLRAAYREHLTRLNMRRLLPRTQRPVPDTDADTESVEMKRVPKVKPGRRNRLMAQWFQAKCDSDITWC